MLVSINPIFKGQYLYKKNQQPIKNNNYTERGFDDYLAAFGNNLKHTINYNQNKKADIIPEFKELLRNKTILDLYKKGAIDRNILGLMSNVSIECAQKMAVYLADEKISKTFCLADICKLSALEDNLQEEIVELIKNDKVVNHEDSCMIAFDEATKEKFDNYTEGGGIEPKTASILANISGIENYDINAVCKLLDSINATQTSKSRTSFVVEKFLRKNSWLDLEDFSSYINKIDFQELEKIAPDIALFEPEQYLTFASYWYLDKKTTFNKNDLNFGGMTSYLADNYVDAIDLSELLGAFPATDRRVGKMPPGWLSGCKSESQLKEEVYQAIERFQKTKDIDDFSKKLGNIIQKEVSVEKTGSGIYGTVYRISVKGANDVCLKLFDQIGNITNSSSNLHGEHIEVQTGLFVNKHSCEFVKLYFGQVSPSNTNDGFLVTQYIDNDTIIDKSTGQDAINWEITTKDADKTTGKNTIQGLIIDFGLVEIKKDGKYITKWSKQ